MKFKKIKFSPIMTFIMLTLITIILSGILGFFNVQVEYKTINAITGQFEINVAEIMSLFSLGGLKYIATNAVNGFVFFAPLSMIIIVLMGVGILEKTGFMKTFFSIITQSFSKNTLTYVLILISLLFSTVGDIGYVIMLPVGALLFKYGKRNPLGGIISTFAALSFGSGINLFLSLNDTNLLDLTVNAAKILDPKYSISNFFMLFVMIVVLLVVSIVFTRITEKIIMPRLGRENIEEEIDEKLKPSNRELKGIILSLASGFIYILLVAYLIIPGLPFSGGLLDDNGIRYIDKLFGPNSLFSQGFIFIVTMLFFIIGFIYGMVTKSLKSNKEVTDSLSYSLDNIGNILVMIFFASLFIGVFKKTNIGLVIIASLTNLLSDLQLSGILLIIILFIISAISNLFYTSPTLKWALISAVGVPMFMNASLSPEYAQLVYTAGYSVTNGLTPLLAYFVIYIAFMQKYKTDGNITLFGSLKHMVPYSLAILVISFIIVVGWYITGLPIGIGSMPVVNYVS